jgi:AraC family transcriptional regulator of adaptative response / DNA-3-methyladenine glycosylase II
MDLDPDLCHRACATRDRRFDGRFFVGVTSTIMRNR